MERKAVNKWIKATGSGLYSSEPHNQPLQSFTGKRQTGCCSRCPVMVNSPVYWLLNINRHRLFGKNVRQPVSDFLNA